MARAAQQHSDQKAADAEEEKPEIISLAVADKCEIGFGVCLADHSGRPIEQNRGFLQSEQTRGNDRSLDQPESSGQDRQQGAEFNKDQRQKDGERASLSGQLAL